MVRHSGGQYLGPVHFILTCSSVVINDENQAVEHSNMIKDTIWAIEALALLVDDAGQIII